MKTPPRNNSSKAFWSTRKPLGVLCSCVNSPPHILNPCFSSVSSAIGMKTPPRKNSSKAFWSTWEPLGVLYSYINSPATYSARK